MKSKCQSILRDAGVKGPRCPGNFAHSMPQSHQCKDFAATYCWTMTCYNLYDAAKCKGHLQMLSALATQSSEMMVWNMRVLTCKGEDVAVNVKMWDAVGHSEQWISGISKEDVGVEAQLEYEKYSLSLCQIAEEILINSREHDPAWWTAAMRTLQVANSDAADAVHRPYLCRLCGKAPSSAHFMCSKHRDRLKWCTPPVLDPQSQKKILGHRWDADLKVWLDLYVDPDED